VVSKRPRFWNGNAVRISSLVRTGPSVDEHFKGPRSQKRREVSYLYNAQINFGRKDQDSKFRTDAGDRAETSAHVVLRTCDLAPHTALPRPEKGWKVTAIYVGESEEQATDYLIEEVRVESPLRGRPLLVYCVFAENRDRGPA
jgi:hypothetical protein